MAKFLVIGTLAWDRIVHLNKKLFSGARIHGQNTLHADGEALGGRLGGGAANASAALISAGHKVVVFAGIPDGRMGDRIADHAVRVGMEMDLVRRIPVPRAVTIIMIEPDGERTILGVSPEPARDRSNWRSAMMNCAPLTSDDVKRVAPDGVFLRAALPGCENISNLQRAKIVAHWPLANHQTKIPIDVFLASADDLGGSAAPTKLVGLASEIAGKRFRGFVVTEGASGGVVFTQDSTFRYNAPRVEQTDATGAGDSFAAGLLEALVAGANLREAVDHGSNWGAIAASQGGTLHDYRPGLFPNHSSLRAP